MGCYHFHLNQLSRGMIADLAIHDPKKAKDKIPNPHMHIMVPIRPLQEDGTWGQKQKKVLVLTPDGQPVLNQKGQPVFRAVHTTDWSKKETLEELRSAWASMCNELYEEKGLTERVDARSYEERGLIRSRWCMKDRMYRQWKQEEFQPHWEVSTDLSEP